MWTMPINHTCHVAWAKNHNKGRSCTFSTLPSYSESSTSQAWVITIFTQWYHVPRHFCTASSDIHSVGISLWEDIHSISTHQRASKGTAWYRWWGTTREYHGFWNPLWVAGRVRGVGVGVAKLLPQWHPHPQDGLTGFGGFFPRVYEGLRRRRISSPHFTTEPASPSLLMQKIK